MLLEELPTSDKWAEFFSDGFFGYGDKGNFQMFSFFHFLPVILLIVVIILTYKFRENIKNYKYEKTVRYILACVMLFAEMGYFWRLLYIGNSDLGERTLLTRLPFQICEWTCIFAAIMLFTESKHLFDIDIFVCLTIGLLPLAYPAVISRTGPLYFRYYQYWLEHLLPVYSVFYMMFIKGFKYDLKKCYKSFIFLFILGIICIYLNYQIPNATYMYLQGDALGEGLSSILPENQFGRLAIYLGVCSILFGIEFLAFYLVSLFKRKRIENEVVEDNTI